MNRKLRRAYEKQKTKAQQAWDRSNDPARLLMVRTAIAVEGITGKPASKVSEEYKAKVS